MNKSKYLYYLGQKAIRNILKDAPYSKVGKRTFSGRYLPSYDETQNLIGDYILSERPFSLIRPGMVEIKKAADIEEKELFGRYLYPRKGTGSSFFGRNTYQVDERFKMLRNDLAASDIISCFNNYALEEYLVSEYAGDAVIIDSRNVFPLYAQKPWTDALHGKKVVVVSIFADYLTEQYNKRDRIFDGKWEFPDMELIPVKSVWFRDFKDECGGYLGVIDYLFEQISAYDYDIALLSCGSMAIHLAPMIKASGKQAIQIAGELQLYFGIKGYRWDNNPKIAPYYNDSWIRVSKEDTGISEEASKRLDGGKCYW